MSRQPYTYTMPESFLRDKSVPARWRLLAVINGFIMNGGCFYGSNEWLMDKLDCSEQTISNAVEELEKLDEIVCTRTRRSRVINRKLRDPNQLGSETQVGSSRDPSWFGTNSVSNSDNNTSAKALVEEVPDKPTPDKGHLEIFKLFSPSKQGWMFHKAQIEAGKRLYKKPGVERVRRVLEFYQEHKDDPLCPVIDTPFDLEAKVNKLTAFKRKNNL